MEAKLIPVLGGKPISINSDLVLVGRKHGLCDLILEKASVSKLHCLIVKTDGLLFVRDLGSTNGTKVNGQRVTRGALLPGDELAFASVKYRVHLGPGQPPSEDDSVERFHTEPIVDIGDSDNDSVAGEAEFPSAVVRGWNDSDDVPPALSNSDSQSDVRLLSDDGID
ncbi:FHA domain-containing protein [Thalassoroseus pseudoceratinae]|uniref:FHA domain-containing protein n=1 Tax=Thalassoroseus pseudoceratinae TaxID=2713176 RepID=UPI001422EC90|nr:FHA domain-containing protein [Thalassoroseus pseudoceratinae]